MNRMNLERAVTLRHVLHRYPELSGREYETKKRLMDFLRQYTCLCLTDCGSWFYASYRPKEEKRSPIAFRADFDGLAVCEDQTLLPYASERRGISHKCGHDGHSAALCAFALELRDLKPDRMIYLIFQHGEETGEGGSLCASLLREKGISQVYACHNWQGLKRGSIAVRTGISQCASVGLSVRFEGRPAHAGSMNGAANPARAMMDMLSVFFSYKNREDPVSMVTVVYAKAGEEGFGITPASSLTCATLRSEAEEDLKALIGKFKEEAVMIAKSHGLSVNFSLEEYFPETKNAALSVLSVKAACKELGYDISELTRPFMPSEDFGWYLKEVPGCMFYIGNGENYPPLHDPDYDFLDEHIEKICELYKALANLS